MAKKYMVIYVDDEGLDGFDSMFGARIGGLYESTALDICDNLNRTTILKGKYVVREENRDGDSPQI